MQEAAGGTNASSLSRSLLSMYAFATLIAVAGLALAIGPSWILGIGLTAMGAAIVLVERCGRGRKLTGWGTAAVTAVAVGFLVELVVALALTPAASAAV